MCSPCPLSPTDFSRARASQTELPSARSPPLFLPRLSGYSRREGNTLMAVAARRIGAESSATRALIIEAAELVMIEEGYAAASTRRVAARAGLKPSLVHYYFPTTEDLLLAVNRKGAAESDRRLDEALSSPDPLRA